MRMLKNRTAIQGKVKQPAGRAFRCMLAVSSIVAGSVLSLGTALAEKCTVRPITRGVPSAKAPIGVDTSAGKGITIRFRDVLPGRHADVRLPESFVLPLWNDVLAGVPDAGKTFRSAVKYAAKEGLEAFAGSKGGKAEFSCTPDQGLRERELGVFHSIHARSETHDILAAYGHWKEAWLLLGKSAPSSEELEKAAQALEKADAALAVAKELPLLFIPGKNLAGARRHIEKLARERTSAGAGK